ncbi:MAG: hypothetical protein OEY94_09100 [Alphaproteobacteria bacterium]|nr:hypothetical protein [Alphaproteobacteria bacterium]
MIQNYRSVFPLLLILFIALVPWLTQQVDIRIPGDAAFLFTGAGHIFAGHNMLDYYYDTNPPMSFLIYTPSVLLQGLGFDAHTSIYLFTFLLIATSTAFFAYLLCFYNLEGIHRAALLSSYLASVTLFSFNEFTQKDHLIAITLPVFLLAQLLILQENKPKDSILFLAFLILTPFILIKPHYGLLPAFVILYRIWQNKNLLSLFKVDFIALTTGVIAYGLAIFTFFPEYVSEIFGISLDLYFGSDSMVGDTGKKALVIAAMSLCITAIASFGNDTTDQKKINVFLGSMATLTAIPFWVQNKGFSVHLLPTISLLIPAIFCVATESLPVKTFSALKKPHITALSIIAVFYLAFILGPETSKRMEFEDSSLARLVKEKAGDKPFLFQSESTNIFYSQSLYIDNDVGSRFPSLWFLARLHTIKNEEKRKDMTNMFARYFAQDLERLQPKIIGLVQPSKGKTNAVFYYFQGNPEFDTAWRKYRKTEEYKLSPLEFSDFLLRKNAKDVVFDIYEHID